MTQIVIIGWKTNSTSKYFISHFQTLSPSGDKLSLLGLYLLTSLIFVFFQVLEFALVLVLKDLYEPKLGKTTNHDDKSDSGKIISRQMQEMQSSMGNVLPFEEMNSDIDINSRRFWVKQPKFFEKLPLTRKIDFLAFIIYHIAYLLFNIIYWNQCGR